MNDPKEIKKSFDTILNITTELVPKKTPRDAKKRMKFAKIIKTIEEIYSRSGMLITEFGIDFSEYDAPMFQLIDDLLEIAYDKQILEIIHFYMFNRVNPNGGKNFLLDKNQNPIHLDDINDLWNLITHIKTQTK